MENMHEGAVGERIHLLSSVPFSTPLFDRLVPMIYTKAGNLHPSSPNLKTSLSFLLPIQLDLIHGVLPARRKMRRLQMPRDWRVATGQREAFC